ncbi:MAG: pyrroloquinoline quinone biosynthesis peptide chaperone PqqD [Micropepsaceae bacterium]
MTDDLKPRLAPGVKLRIDDRRGPVLLGPERVLELDEIAQQIVSQFDGTKRISEIAAGLAREYDEKADVIRADIDNLLKDLAAKGYVKP